MNGGNGCTEVWVALLTVTVNAPPPPGPDLLVTVTVAGVLVLSPKVLSPRYAATIVCCPTKKVSRLILTLPQEPVPVPKMLVPSRKSPVPVAGEVPVAVRFNGPPDC